MHIMGGVFSGSARRAVHALPPRVRLAVDVSTGVVSDTSVNWRRQGYVVKGQLNSSGREGSLIHFGQLPQYSGWIANLFAECVPGEPIGRFSIWEIAKREGRLAEADVLLCPLNPLTKFVFGKYNWFVVPKQIRCLVDLRQPIENLVRRHGVKDDLRIARKRNFRFDVLKDDAAFDEFYHEMLVPTITLRHENRAQISSLEDMRRRFHSGYLLAAYQSDQWVGASLMIREASKVLNWANVGWRGGSEQLMKDRLVSALMLEMVIRGKGEHFETLDLGSCGPFVNDGPLSYKLKWGATMALPRYCYEDDQLQGLHSYLGAHFNFAREGGRGALMHCPILDEFKGRLRAVGWASTLRPDFKRQVEEGLAWINLAQRSDAETGDAGRHSVTRSKSFEQ